MTTILLKNARGHSRGPFARLLDLLRSGRAHEADVIVARYASGRMTDAAEREMTERLLHVGESFRF